MPMNENDREVVQITRFEDTPEYQGFYTRMQEMLGTGHDPYFIRHDSPLTDTSLVDGRRVLNFGSYNYVGMSGRKEVSEAAKKAIDDYGTSASGSRLISGEKSLMTLQVTDGEPAEAIVRPAEWLSSDLQNRG